MLSAQDRKRNHKSETDSDSSLIEHSPAHKQIQKRQKNNSNNSCQSESAIFKMDEQLIADMINKGITQALNDPKIIGLITESVSIKLTSKVEELTESLEEANTKIVKLESQVEELEMYGRRNGIRLYGIPQHKGESTDEIVLKVARSIGAKIPDFALGRSHRVQRMNTTTENRNKPLPIIAKFISHNFKVEMLKCKGELQNLGPNAIVQGSGDIFINEDLTSMRAGWAQRARKLKKDDKCISTWTRDGTILIKLSEEKIVRVNSEVTLSGLEGSLPVIPDIITKRQHTKPKRVV